MKRYGTIYLIKNRTNGLSYIGQTIQPVLARWKGHIKSKKTVISKEIKTLGKENFDFVEILSCFSKDDLNYFEQYFIEHFNTMNPNGYNMKTGGNTCTFTQEVKERMSKAKLGKESHCHIVPIIAKNVLTNKTKKYESLKAACKKLNISRSSILKSITYGLIRKNYRFFYANQSESSFNNKFEHAQRLEGETVKTEYNPSTSPRFPKKYMELKSTILELKDKNLTAYAISKVLNLDKSMVNYFIHCIGK